MRQRYFYTILTAAVLTVLLLQPTLAQRAAPAVSDQPDTSFKLATFDSQGKVGVGLVLGDYVLDISGANAHLMKQARLPAMRMPAEMRELIEQYGTVSKRLYQIANYWKDKKLDGLGFAHEISRVSLKAPIKYPYNLLCMAANYRTHAAEMGVAAQIDPDKDDPYIFAKSPRSCIIDPGTPYIIPPARQRIDWEGELAFVVAKPAFNVSLQKADDYIFGYTIMYDVSDRGGGRRTKPMFQGPDWFSGKSRDGAAPMGPFIVPKEFLPNHASLRIRTWVNDRVVQDGNTKYLIYDVEHILAYASSILTLYPGDVFSTGTPDGVGAARKPPEFLKPGDTVTIEIEGIGTLKTPLQAGSSPAQ